MMVNSGQSCTAPSRMFVPSERHEEVKAIAKEAAERFVVGEYVSIGHEGTMHTYQIARVERP